MLNQRAFLPGQVHILFILPEDVLVDFLKLELLKSAAILIFGPVELKSLQGGIEEKNSWQEFQDPDRLEFKKEELENVPAKLK